MTKYLDEHWLDVTNNYGNVEFFSYHKLRRPFKYDPGCVLRSEKTGMDV